MTDRRRDPLELWVGTWTPEEWIARENRKREGSGSAEGTVPESASAEAPPETA